MAQITSVHVSAHACLMWRKNVIACAKNFAGDGGTQKGTNEGKILKAIAIDGVQHNFDSIPYIDPFRQNWTIKARVLRLWLLPPYPKSSAHDSLKMVLCDRESTSSMAVVVLPVLDLMMSGEEDEELGYGEEVWDHSQYLSIGSNLDLSKRKAFGMDHGRCF
ncbi:Glycoside hydrolase [Senna tora]|uniref:Glycoside hydrolase n=1 Tax=Senna tora TaxID=362788 RepID=A0A834TGZ7_9FABA|nr:Glycoside hydrolase [Senna tora]